MTQKKQETETYRMIPSELIRPGQDDGLTKLKSQDDASMMVRFYRIISQDDIRMTWPKNRLEIKHFFLSPIILV